MTEKLRMIETAPAEAALPAPQVLPPPIPPNVLPEQAVDAVEEPPEKESLPAGILGGALGGLGGALLWATITAVTQFQIGWMAIGVGFLVGLGCRRLGKGTTSTFGIVGATISVLACLVGNLLAYCIMGAAEAGVPLWAALLGLLLQPTLTFDLMYAGFGPMDILFYALAIYAGYRNSYVNVAEQY